MPSMGQHCPFLNRADARCSEAFNLDRLDHAFKYCFGRYTSCPIYVELLIERRVRHSAAEVADHSHGYNGHIQVTVHRSFRKVETSAGDEPVPDLPVGGKRTVR